MKTKIHAGWPKALWFTLILWGWLLCPVSRAQLTYVTNNGSITITGYAGTIDRLNIPDTINSLPVSNIGDNAFKNHPWDLWTVTIPSGVTNIGVGAFSYCFSMNSITLPTNLVTIGAQAFFSDYLLRPITIPNTVTTIGDQALDDTYLTSVTIPASVTNLGFAPFDACYWLTNISVDPANPAYANDAAGVLYNKALTTLVQYPCGVYGGYCIPAGVTSLADYAFADASLNWVVVPDSTTYIGTNEFSACPLTNVILGAGVNYVASGAFGGSTGIPIYCKGNAPAAGYEAFFTPAGLNPDMIYYLPGTTGWGTSFYGLPTVPWYLPAPTILNNGLGLQNNQFGFMISWATNNPVVIEACTNLANAVWEPVQTLSLVNGTNYYCDPNSLRASGCFYRVRSP